MYKSKFLLVFFLFLYLNVSASDNVRVLGSDASSLLLEFNLKNLNLNERVIDNQKYFDISFASSMVDLSEIGMPQIPYQVLSVGVPSEFGNTIQVVSFTKRELDGKLVPVPAQVKDNISVSSQYNISSNYFDQNEGELIRFGGFGIARDLPIQMINIFPVQFDAASNNIKIYETIVFRINFGSANRRLKHVSESYLKDAVINFDQARNWGIAESVSDKLLKQANSVLAQGDWYKFEISEEGIYRIDRNTLQALGIDPNSADPRNLKIYGNGGYQLPESVDALRPVDLQELAIFVSGQSDGSFDQNDYILFYGRGSTFVEYDNTQKRLVRKKHFYSEKNYYWITASGTAGKRMADKNSLSSPAQYVQTLTKSALYHEDDRVNLIKSGRLYVGEEFNTSNKSRTYLNSLNNLVPGSQINYKYQFINFSKTSTILQLEENGTVIDSRFAGPAPGTYGVGSLNTGSINYSGTIPNNRSVVKFTFDTKNASVTGYLDYLEIYYNSNLRAANDEIYFYSADTTAIIQYDIFDFSNSSFEVFDITDHANVKIIKGHNLSAGQTSFKIQENAGAVSKYYAVNTSKFKIPAPAVKADNSNLLGELSGAESIIITHKNFEVQANRLANYRANTAPVKVSTKVIFINDIFNEFSGGLIDPTAIRDFLKFAYYNWQTKPFYVLLFGDGVYDVLDREGLGNNFIPTYQTVQSLDEVDAYPTDDYYARVTSGDKALDFAIGRLNINTANEGDIIIDKIIDYETISEKGLWRNTITLVADDGLTSTGDDGFTHTRQSESLGRDIIPPYFDKNKIYLATYSTVITGLGRRKPAVNQAIIDAVNNGTLLLNFIGHGNPRVWTHEEVFNRDATIPQFINDKYFFLTAATCDFGKFDDPSVQSSTELMLFIPNAAMIGGFTAARPVYSGQNAELNEQFYNNLLGVKDSMNRHIPVGHAFFLSKQSGVGIIRNSEKFHLFADPALRLNQPEIPVNIDSVNGNDLTANVQIKALGEVQIEGTVSNFNNSTNTNFNGEAILSVFDSERKVDLPELASYASMSLQGGVIFRGRVSVNAGKFKANFTVPKDISYENKNGKIVIYAFDSNTDGVGYTNSIIVGGTDSTAVSDGKGPEIEIFYDNLNYDNSYLVAPEFDLLVKLKDETGLNTTGTGVGHKLEGILNEDAENPIDFTNFFIGDLDSGGKSGIIDYKFNSMETGDYFIKIKAWDVFNNFSTAESNFTVVEDNRLAIENVVNYPNPFASNTTFTFQHNLSDAVNVKIQIYTIAGRKIREIEVPSIIDRFVRIDWDGRDQDNSIIANGTYFYKLTVESVNGNFKENVLGKLAVIR